MPVLCEYKNEPGGYVLTRIRNHIVTVQLTHRAFQSLREQGIEPRKTFHRAILMELIKSGDAYTRGSGPGEIGEGLPAGQLEFDFQDDPHPETLMPTCARCHSAMDLHLTTVLSNDKLLLQLLCQGCRPQAIRDISIPLRFVDRQTLQTIATTAGATVHASVIQYQKLLDTEFTQKWEALAARKTIRQGSLFDEEPGGLGL